jgi:hypothetical protein
MTEPFIRPLAAEARVLVELEGRPLERYAVMLQLRVEGRWQTIRTLGSNRRIMEELEPSKFTPAGEIANDRLIEAATEPDRYPEGTAFIAADQEHFGSVLAEAVAEHRPLAIVYPDGREIVAAPRGGALAFFELLLTRRRESKREYREPAVPLPADYQVEIRDPQPLAAA